MMPHLGFVFTTEMRRRRKRSLLELKYPILLCIECQSMYKCYLLSHIPHHPPNRPPPQHLPQIILIKFHAPYIPASQASYSSSHPLSKAWLVSLHLADARWDGIVLYSAASASSGCGCAQSTLGKGSPERTGVGASGQSLISIDDSRSTLDERWAAGLSVSLLVISFAYDRIAVTHRAMASITSCMARNRPSVGIPFTNVGFLAVVMPCFSTKFHKTS
jgi:hypothetical protein